MYESSPAPLKTLLCLVFFFLMTNEIFAQNEINESGKGAFSSQLRSLQSLAGKWTGTLTYLDYTSGKPYSMPAIINIREEPGKENSFVRNIEYPNERSADSKDTLALSADSTQFNGEQIVLLSSPSEGASQLVTEITGVDGNDDRPALIRHLYSWGGGKLSISKEVKFLDGAEWILRHRYELRK
jgi:hypothetical protein